ncbi:MAG: DUF559 domain-containing protein [Acidimicrobiales bacterium]|nr:DUF559 domain-containing protein [Acidimicrobiales bacterium]
MNTTQDDMLDIAARHQGVIDRAALDRLGVTRSRLRHLVATGVLRRRGNRTFVVGGSPDTIEQRIVVACREVGGVASHRTAAWLHRLPGFQPMRPPEVTVEARSSSYVGHLAAVHCSTWVPRDDRTAVRGVPTLSVARTLFSLAALVPTVPAEVLRGAVDEAVRARKASDPWLWWRLEQVRCRGRDGVAAFEEVLVRRAGGAATESWLERAFLELVAASALPVPVCQQRVGARGAFVARVDFLFPGTTVVVEVSGHTHHASEAQLARDARRRNELQMAGWVVLEFTYDDVVSRPNEVVACLRRALALSDVA